MYVLSWLKNLKKMSKLTSQVRQEGQAQELQSNKSASKKKKTL